MQRSHGLSLSVLNAILMHLIPFHFFENEFRFFPKNIVYPSVYSAIAAFIVNGICCYVFVYVCDLGVR